MADNRINSDNDPAELLWAFLGFSVLVGVLLYLLWEQIHIPIKAATLESSIILRYVQFPLVPFVTDSYANKLLRLNEIRGTVTAESMSNGVLLQLLSISFRSIVILLAFYLIPRSIYLVKNHTKLLYERELNLDSLIELQREKYPRIKPPTATNLLKVDPHFGSWSTHQNQIEFAIDNGLLQFENDLSSLSEEEKNTFEKRVERLALVQLKAPKEYLTGNEGMTLHKFRGLNFPTGFSQEHSDDLKVFYREMTHYLGLLKIKRSNLENYYRQTLGPACIYHNRVIDINYLPPIERSLWILLCACIASKSELRHGKNDSETRSVSIEGLLDQFSSSFVEGEFRSNNHSINLEGVMELYDEVKNDSKVKLALVDIAAGHAYYYTAFTRLYTLAKDAYGTIISRDFIWLKTVNRTLYFALNQIGLEAPRIETSAIRAHYRAEDKAGMKILTPIIESTILNYHHEMFNQGWLTIQKTEQDKFGRAHWLGKAPVDEESE